MHDPMTVAFEIKSPFKNKPNSLFPKGYRETLITVWHVDPETDGTDDSCGWSRPRHSKETIAEIKEIAHSQYGQLFAKQVATNRGESYAHICYDQDIYGAIYWSWRALKSRNKDGWQYGESLNHKELNFIYQLATNPVDNFQHTKITTEEQFEQFFLLIWSAFSAFYRPWYKHPRWHVSHWKFQIHPIQNLKRRLWDKCSVCGERGFKGAAYSDWHGTKIWHAECDNTSKSVCNAPLQ